MKFTDYRTFKTAIGGKLLELEIGKVCELANGRVMVKIRRYSRKRNGVRVKRAKTGHRFFPAVRDYEEKMYAAGKIRAIYKERSEDLAKRRDPHSRLMDRPLRPLFPEGFFNDVQAL